MVNVVLIKRQKKIGVGEHFGVLVDENQVIDFQNEGVRTISLHEFSCNQTFEVTRLSHRSMSQSDFETKLKKIQGFEYDLLSGNCEHWARDFVEGKFDSLQINSAVVFSLIGLAVYALS